MIKSVSCYLLCLLISAQALGAEALSLIASDNNSFEVSYSYQGKRYIFPATLDGDTYVFNAKSDKVLNIATLDWPPYVGQKLCNLGWSLQLAVALLTAKNYQVKVSFFPWARAVAMVESGQMEILFPEYFIEDGAPSDIYPNIKRRELLVESNEMLGGNISLFKWHTSDFEFNGNLKVIEDMVVGVVRGYQNTPEFDAMMDKGLIKVIEAVDDAQLLKLLMARRVDLIIGDSQVFHYEIQSSDFSIQEKQMLRAGMIELQPALKYNHLYFAISTKYSKWKPLLEDINLALIEFETSGELLNIFQRGSRCDNH